MRNPPAATSSQLPYSSTIKERDHHSNNVSFYRDSCPNSLQRARTFPNDASDSDLDDEITSDNGVDADAGYLWYGTRRREKRPSPSTPAHQAVTASTTLLLQAHILTGRGGHSSTPWPEESKAWFNNEMADLWQGAAKRYKANFGERDGFVHKVPDRWEAREVISGCPNLF